MEIFLSKGVKYEYKKIGQILEYIKNNEGVTKKDIFDNVAVSEGTLRVYLHRLLNREYRNS